MVVENDRPANHLVDGKTIGQKQGKGKPVVPEQQRQIPGVIGMPAAIGIVMGHGVRKRIAHIAAAVGSLVDVEPKDPLLAGNVRLGQAAQN